MTHPSPASATAGQRAPQSDGQHHQIRAQPLGKTQGRTLLVLDWSPAAAEELQARLRQLQAPRATMATPPRSGSPDDATPWDVLNCPAAAQSAGAARNGMARAALALRYLGTAFVAAWRSRRHAQVVVWQQAIGYLLCLLPRWPGCRLVITTVLLSPSGLPPRSLRRAVLRLALWRADALVYFSREMALDTQRHHPAWAHKVFWTALPHFGLEDAPQDKPNNALTPARSPQEPADQAQALRVFAGGTSERDFDVVIRAFQDSDVPVTLVCRADQVLTPSGHLSPNFSVHREVSHEAFDALVRAADVAVVALKSVTSGCGQLLFTFCMRHGIPLIATDCHGTRDYVLHEQTGLLVPVGDATALRQAYERLARDRALRERLTAQARAQCTQRGLAGFVHDMDAISSRWPSRQRAQLPVS